jgi:hypothetical protein
MTVRSATRLKTGATGYVYAIDVEFDVPGMTAPPGRYEISVAPGGDRYLAGRRTTTWTSSRSSDDTRHTWCHGAV